MVREISREVDYVKESVSLLKHLGAGKKFRELRESMERKYASPFREGLRKFEVLEQIEQEAARVFSEDTEQLRYYFPKQDDAAMGCAGNLALLWEDYERVDFRDIAAFGAYLRDLPEQAYCERFGFCLQGYTESVVRDKKMVRMSEPYAVICYLMAMDIRDEEKWKIQTIFFDRTGHTEKLLALLEKAEKLLKGYRRELEELVLLFYQYWSEKLEGQDPASYIGRETNVKITGSPVGFRVEASVIHCNEITLNNDMGEDGCTYEDPDYYRIGILFGEDFAIGINPRQQDESFESYAVSVLKLLADKSKFAILSYIRDRKAYGSELAKHLKLTTATVSHHMNVLLAAGLVEVSHVDNRVYYTASRKALEEVFEYCRRTLT